jgi:hypothetical protein
VPTPPFAAIALGLAVVLTIAIGVWYFLLRGGGGSEFVTALDRFVAAERAAEAAQEDVTRFVELEEFYDAVIKQLGAMERQALVFDRIAAETDGERGELADDAVAAADMVIENTRAYLDAMLRRRLAQVRQVVAEMKAGVVELERVAAEWQADG